MTPVQVLADTLQVDPATIKAALHGHGFTLCRQRPLAWIWAAGITAGYSVDRSDLYGDDEPAWLAARGAITPRPDALPAERVIRQLRDNWLAPSLDALYQPGYENDPEAPT